MPMPPRKGKRLELRVERQILWVGAAAIPVRNVSWVEVFRSTPDWGKVSAYCLLWVAFAVVLSAQLSGPAPAILALCTAVVVCAVLLRSRKPTLVVELNSGSRVGLTLPTMDELRAVAGQLVYAIDHPEYEFSTVLEQHSITNNFGSVVNMNGGRGNTGIKL